MKERDGVVFPLSRVWVFIWIVVHSFNSLDHVLFYFLFLLMFSGLVVLISFDDSA